ncbi:hypothetical protein BY458DRAFT_508511 [Sporodiniella umbellata]|nr:hypothetical protein BY458DRAFT_508511 [Sporodiniella umbellata]
MTMPIADLFEDYVESLQNLPFEIDQNMQELRRMDEEFQRLRETYTKHKKAYAKMHKLDSKPTDSNLSPPKTQIEKDYKLALQKQDQKIDLTKKMYDLVSRHIERIDSQMAKSDIGEDWMGRKVYDQDSWRSTERKQTLPYSSRKRKVVPSFRANLGDQNGVMPAMDIDPNEPKYCYCNQVSFGDMVACDGENCEKEWFHYACAGLHEPPVGKWYCNDCTTDEGNRKKYKFAEDIY